MFSKILKKHIVYFALFTLVYPMFHPIALYAQALQSGDLYDQNTLNEYQNQGWEPYDPDEMVDWINEGRDLFDGAPVPSFNTNTGQLQPMDPATGAPLLNEDGSPTTVESVDLGDDGQNGNTTTDSDNYGDNNSMIIRGTGERTRLYNTGDFDADPDAPADAQAYRMMRQGYSAPTPDVENDPVFAGSDYVTSAQGQADFDDHYGRGCETNPALVNSTPQILSVPDIRQCTRAVTPAQTCTAQHNVTFTTPIVDVIFLIDASQTPWTENHSERGIFATINMLEDIVPLDEYDIEVGIGLYGHPNNNAEFFQTPPIMMPTKDPAVLSTFLTGATPILGFGAANFYHTFHTYNHYYTPRPGAETVYIVVHGERSFTNTTLTMGWIQDPNDPGSFVFIGDSSLYPFSSANFVGLGSPSPPHIYVSTPDTDLVPFVPTEFMAYPLSHDQILATIGQFAEVETDQWVSAGNCLTILANASAADCDINFTEILPEYEPKCSLMDDRMVCDNSVVYQNMAQFPHAIDGVNRLTTSFTAAYSCNNLNSTCDALEADPQCSYVATTPVGDPDILGNYSQHAEEWDCGVPIAAPTLVSPQGYSNCGNAPTRCAMGECIDPAREGSVAFGEVAAAATAVDMVAFDSMCDITQPETCMVFAGTDYNCHTVGPDGILLDCCDVPVGATLTQYMSAFALMRQVDSSYGSPIGNLVTGGWTMVTEAASAGGASFYNAIGRPFASAAESLTANWQGVMSEGLLDQFKQRILQYAADTIADLFGQQAADALFSYGANGAVDGIGGTVLGPAISALGVLMTAYMYYQLAVLIIGILDGCDEDVGELAQKRELQSCVYVGNECPPFIPFLGLFGCLTREDRAYCCFNSPISLIIQESAKAQFGTNFGNYDNPNCDGLTFEQLATIDWEQIDWGRWQGIMVQADMMPNPADMNIDVLTGNESPLQLGSPWPPGSPGETLCPDPGGANAALCESTQVQRANTAERNTGRYSNMTVTVTEDQINRGVEDSTFPMTITTQ